MSKSRQRILLKLHMIVFQDSAGSITGLNERECETLLCIQVLDEESVSPGVFWMKIRQGGWHRFFLDASYYFLSWTEFDKLNQSELEDEEDYPVANLGEKYGFENRTIIGIEMNQLQSAAGIEGCLTIYFSEGRLLEVRQNDESSSLKIINAP